jgi:hypothetical protein
MNPEDGGACDEYKSTTTYASGPVATNEPTSVPPIDASVKSRH